MQKKIAFLDILRFTSQFLIMYMYENDMYTCISNNLAKYIHYCIWKRKLKITLWNLVLWNQRLEQQFSIYKNKGNWYATSNEWEFNYYNVKQKTKFIPQSPIGQYVT
jgi:hypothetical protein